MADGRDEVRQKSRTSNKYAAKKQATERIAAQRAAHQRAERRRNILIAGASTLAVLIVVGVIVGIGLSQKKKTSADSTPVPASDTVTSALSDAATSTLASTPDLSAVGNPPSLISGGAALTSPGGLPQVLYVGAEYCPNCAATRWPLALALARFGTFSDLSTMYSSEDNLPTLSFHGSSYTSQYLDFDGKEQVDGENKPLETLTAAESQLFETLGIGPGGSSPGYPFIDFGGKWRQNGTVFDPTVISGMTPESVAKAMTDSDSKVGKSIKASADVYTAIICELDGGKPANVCTAPGVTTAETAINGAGK